MSGNPVCLLNLFPKYFYSQQRCPDSMDVIADLQIHGRYSRATSNALSIDNLEKFARIKGVNLLGTGDFQHPLWAKEIKEKLTEDDNGILWTKNRFPFIWQTEISLIYTQG